LRLRDRPHFERTTILRLTDQTLSSSYVQAVSKPHEVPATFQMINIGQRFIDNLEAASLDQLVDGTVPYEPVITEAYRSTLQALTSTKKPEELDYGRDLISPIDMMESVVAHHVVVPLIQLRLNTNHEVFYNVWKYLELIRDLPAPPMLMIEGKAYFASYLNTTSKIGASFHDAWIKYCMITHVIHEMYSFKSSVTCFRAHQIKSTQINLCQRGSCAGNIAAGRCQEWHPGQELPNCLFASLLAQLGLVPRDDLKVSETPWLAT
jgi:hypothetical protein